MILASRFPGDDNRLLMKAQADAYGDMLMLLFRTARMRASVTPEKRQHGIDMPLLATADQRETFDHRVLQEAHDLIAAYYRYLVRDYATPCFADDPDMHKAYLRESWQVYTRYEVTDLTWAPAFAAEVLRAVVYANTEKGYAAEDLLSQMLKARYSPILD